MYILCTINNPKYRYFFQFEQLDFFPKECPGLYCLFFSDQTLYFSWIAEADDEEFEGYDPKCP